MQSISFSLIAMGRNSLRFGANRPHSGNSVVVTSSLDVAKISVLPRCKKCLTALKQFAVQYQISVLLISSYLNRISDMITLVNVDDALQKRMNPESDSLYGGELSMRIVSSFSQNDISNSCPLSTCRCDSTYTYAHSSNTLSFAVVPGSLSSLWWSHLASC